MRTYCGVGSRGTPLENQEVMTLMADQYRELGWILRSGHAPGADQAFEAGAMDRAEIFLPWPSFESRVEIHPEAVIFKKPLAKAYEMAKEIHPAWERCSRGARSLHARNVHQIMGFHLDDPVEHVICWTPDGATKASEVTKETGGTGQAIRLADKYGIPVENLRNS